MGCTIGVCISEVDIWSDGNISIDNDNLPTPDNIKVPEAVA